MKFKLSFIVVLLAALSLTAPAFACEGNDCDEASGIGTVNGGALVIGGGFSGDLDLVFDGYRCHRELTGLAGGIGVVGGIAGGEFDGFVVNGDISGDISVTAGGVTKTDTWEGYDFGEGSIVHYVGSSTHNLAVATGELNVESDPATIRTRRGSYPIGFGLVGGDIFGLVGQGSLNVSGMTLPGALYDTEGLTFGLAGQGSIGGFCGYAIAWDGKAGIDVSINMEGGSFSESYRGAQYNDGWTTEFMGTNVGAFTSIDTEVDTYDYGDSSADVQGGFGAIGGAATFTAQHGDNGMAIAGAQGTYAGAGELGCDYDGSVEGYSFTSYSTLEGYNGAIVTGSAGMSVSSRTNAAARR